MALVLVLTSSSVAYAQEATPAQKDCNNGLANIDCEDRSKALGLSAAVVAIGVVALGVGAIATTRRTK